MAKAVPWVSVFDKWAKVMHEAAIGSVDTLIFCGLDKSKAVDVIVSRLLNALYRPRYIL